MRSDHRGPRRRSTPGRPARAPLASAQPDMRQVPSAPAPGHTLPATALGCAACRGALASSLSSSASEARGSSQSDPPENRCVNVATEGPASPNLGCHSRKKGSHRHCTRQPGGRGSAHQALRAALLFTATGLGPARSQPHRSALARGSPQAQHTCRQPWALAGHQRCPQGTHSGWGHHTHPLGGSAAARPLVSPRQAQRRDPVRPQHLQIPLRVLPNPAVAHLWAPNAKPQAAVGPGGQPPCCRQSRCASTHVCGTHVVHRTATSLANGRLALRVLARA